MTRVTADAMVRFIFKYLAENFLNSTSAQKLFSMRPNYNKLYFYSNSYECIYFNKLISYFNRIISIKINSYHMNITIVLISVFPHRAHANKLEFNFIHLNEYVSDLRKKSYYNASEFAFHFCN